MQATNKAIRAVVISFKISIFALVNTTVGDKVLGGFEL